MATITHPLFDRNRERLATLPPAGGGGCHPALLGVASRCVTIGISVGDIFRDQRERVHGSLVAPRLDGHGALRRTVEAGQTDACGGLGAGVERLMAREGVEA
jgi:hypothetical protein